MLLDLSKLEYCVLPARVLGEEPCRELWRNVYRAWWDVWSLELLPGLLPEFSSDTFLRSDAVACLKYGEEVIGVHLYSYYDLSERAYCDHSFLKRAFTSSYVEHLRREDRTLVMSLEQLTIARSWRKHASGFSFSEILIALGIEYFTRTGCAAVIGSTRNSRKVNQQLVRLGWKTVVRDAIVNGEPSDLMYFDQASRVPFGKAPTDDLVWSLWNQRREFIPIRTFRNSRATTRVPLAS